MNKLAMFCCVILLIGAPRLFADDTISEGKAWSFPTKTHGISIGNSHEFTGIRINFSDEDVKRVDGLNITFWFKCDKNQDAVIKGISVGTMPTAGSMQYVNLGLLGTGANDKLNGVSVGGIVIGSGGDINGLSVAGLLIATDQGDVVSINGITVAGLVVGTDGDINGIASSLACLHSRNTQGLSVTAGYLGAEKYKGVAVAGYSKMDQMDGLSIALFNKTRELHGVQFGLLNYAENNPKWLRILPLINLHK